MKPFLKDVLLTSDGGNPKGDTRHKIVACCSQKLCTCKITYKKHSQFKQYVDGSRLLCQSVYILSKSQAG